MTIYEQYGGKYSIIGDYRVPNLTAPDEPDTSIGIWGQRRNNYLKRHRRVLYINLLTSGKLSEHLREIDTAAYKRHETIVRQMMEAQGVDERLKVENQVLWVGKVNNIRACANEIIHKELIYG